MTVFLRGFWTGNFLAWLENFRSSLISPCTFIICFSWGSRTICCHADFSSASFPTLGLLQTLVSRISFPSSSATLKALSSQPPPVPEVSCKTVITTFLLCYLSMTLSFGSAKPSFGPNSDPSSVFLHVCYSSELFAGVIS